MEEKKRSRKKQLFQNIIKQTEFYFSSANLSKDRFLSQRLSENNGCLEVSTLLTFNKIKSLTDDLNVLTKALNLSDKLELNEDKSTVKSKIPIAPKDNIDSCTIYVEHLPPDADIVWLQGIFSPYGNVDYISLPKFSNNKIKGFAFIEFDVPESAKKVIQEFQNAGCYLSTEMAPGNLCSISTYENKDSIQMNIGETSNEDILTNETDMKNIEETNSKEEQITEKNKEERKESKRKVEDDTDDEVLVKKVKVDYDLSCDDQKLSTNENSEIEDLTDQGNPCDENNENSKKRRRKKKKSKKDKVTAINSGLQILSKSDWKKLRNRYLNMQREKMKSLKKHLASNKNNPGFYKHQGVNKATPDPVEFPKTVVKLSLREPVINIKEFKADIKKDSSVQYIDVKEGAAEVHVRLSSPEAAGLFCLDSRWASAIVISGNEERAYWEKINMNRNSKTKKTDITEAIHNLEANGEAEQESTNAVTNKDSILNKPLEMKLHTIVKINMREPILDVKQFKSDLKSKVPRVLYIDIKESSSVVFIRMDSPEDADQFCLDPTWPSAEVIEGEEEQEYWNKIQQDRCLKYESKIKRKKKGKQKLIRKAENVLRTHIIISD